MSFNDHFSGHASEYQRYRPGYPDALFRWLAEVSPGRALAVDVATGNGQAAVPLADHFDQVIAFDASSRQIEQARPSPGVRFAVAAAEDLPLSSASADLLIAAQALHWFDHQRFFAEARRVLRPGGVFAAWCYDLHRIDPAVDELVDSLATEALGAWWPPERHLLREGYRSIALPFAAVSSPAFVMTARWTVDDVLGYLRTWSSTRRFLAARGHDPVEGLEPRLRLAFGVGEREVRWPLSVRVGRLV